jgi:hypothetical protein
MFKRYVFVILSFTLIFFLLLGCSVAKNEIAVEEEATEISTVNSISNSNSVTLVAKEMENVTIIKHEKIHSTLSEFTFKIYGKKSKRDYGEDSYDYSANKIEIYKTVDKKELIQEITFEETNTADAECLGFVIEDMNFDGYKDIRIQQFVPAAPNVLYYCWLWDDKSSKYIENEYLEEITSPEFDYETKTIKSFVRGSAADYAKRIYKYIDDVPALIKEIEIEVKFVDDKTVIHYSRKELENGKMQVIQEYYKPYSENILTKMLEKLEELDI